MDHLAFAHLSWQKHVASLKKPHIVAFDATAGNGHDTLKLAKIMLSQNSGELHSFDIQESAIRSTRELLSKSLPLPILERITLHNLSHKTFPSTLPSPDLVIYNLGYLPGGDKSITTKVETTLESLNSAISRLSSDGLITITLYPGHSEGYIEKGGILDYLSQLDPKCYKIFHYSQLKSNNSPSVIHLQNNVYNRFIEY